MKIQASHISKQFGKEYIISDFNYEFEIDNAYALLGNNGSGKSTLLQMLIGYLAPTKGHLYYQNERGTQIPLEERFKIVSICAPYAELIEELTIQEFFYYHFTFKKPIIPVENVLLEIGLHEHAKKYISQCSSGMKQRIKLAQAIYSDTPILFLDEPCSNLDESGIAFYKRLGDKFFRNRLVIVASNDLNEYEICNEKIELKNYKFSG